MSFRKVMDVRTDFANAGLIITVECGDKTEVFKDISVCQIDDVPSSRVAVCRFILSQENMSLADVVCRQVMAIEKANEWSPEQLIKISEVLNQSYNWPNQKDKDEEREYQRKDLIYRLGTNLMGEDDEKMEFRMKKTIK